MTTDGKLPQSALVEAETLDHAGEFVVRVAEEAPAEYAALLEEPSIRRRLAESNAFNPGKLYAWAEYRVFRREFRRRFPDATPRACINAISMSNLVRTLEAPHGEDLELLEQSGTGQQKKPAG
jgi:hypothetical protein